MNRLQPRQDEFQPGTRVTLRPDSPVALDGLHIGRVLAVETVRQHCERMARRQGRPVGEVTKAAADDLPHQLDREVVTVEFESCPRFPVGLTVGIPREQIARAIGPANTN